ncbi:MAG: hypothetical protein ABEJ31_13075 [Haloarculaceae archaeon]
MVGGSDDPAVLRSIAVTADDLVAALAARRRTNRRTVLRVTPPFSGRMRARLHEATDEPTGYPAPIHVEPESLIADDAPAYPTPAETEDELRADPNAEYTPERHRERHEQAVAAWRERIPAHVVDAVVVETPAGRREVAVALLG